MDKLLAHLMQLHVTRDHSHLIETLCRRQEAAFSSALKISQEDLQLIQYLLEKKIINFHPSLMIIKLNSTSLLFYQRINKLRTFCHKFALPAFTDLFEKFCKNELMPLTIDSHELKKLSGKTSEKGENARKKQMSEGKQVKDSHLIHYERLVYEYREKEEGTKEEGRKEGEREIMINIDEVTEIYRYHLILKQLSSEQRELLRQSLKLKEHSKAELLFLQIYNSAKENPANCDLFKQSAAKLRERKVQEFILQSFRRHAESEEDREELSRNVLLVYNLVRRFPLISEKDLLKMTLMEIVEQRKCLNLLVSEGLLLYFSESIKSVLYKAIDAEQVHAKAINAVATAILNLHVVIGQRKVSKQQMLKMEAMLEDLDDSLLLLEQ